MERSDVMEKMSRDVTDFIDQLPRKEYQDGWPEDRWQEEMEKHPFFMSKPLEGDQELPPEIEAFQQLKYDPEFNSPAELAKVYKEDGNVNFKSKKYRWAIDCYTKGLEMKSQDPQLNAELLVNRAAAQFHIGNYRLSLKDALEALALKPDYKKAAHRCALCYFELNQFVECIACCDKGLLTFPEVPASASVFYTLKNKCQEQKKIFDRNKRRELAQESKKKKEIELLKAEVMGRGISLYKDTLEPDCKEVIFPALSEARVYLKDGALVWPVVFMYPEYHTHDCIQEFHEDTCFEDHLNVMFNPKDSPSWDERQSYIPENLQMYFSLAKDVFPFDKKKSLKEILSHKRYTVHAGIPCFLITEKDSEFDHFFRKQSNVIELKSLL